MRADREKNKLAEKELSGYNYLKFRQIILQLLIYIV